MLIRSRNTYARKIDWVLPIWQTLGDTQSITEEIGASSRRASGQWRCSPLSHKVIDFTHHKENSAFHFSALLIPLLLALELKHFFGTKKLKLAWWWWNIFW